MDAFLELDTNPAKVVALYPESVSGRLHVDSGGWIPIFGGPEPKPKESEPKVEDRRISIHTQGSPTGRSPSPSGSMRSVFPLRRSTLDAILPSSVSAALDKDRDKDKDKDSEDDRASIRGRAVSKAKPKLGGESQN